MSTVIAFSMLLGLLLGRRFRVFILPPAIVVGASVLGAASAWHRDSLAHTVVMIIVFAAMLQLAYFCGALLPRARAPDYAARHTFV